MWGGGGSLDEGNSVRAWVRVCVGVGGCTVAGVCLRACNLTCSAYYTQAPYCLRLLWLHHFFDIISNGTIFGEMSLRTKCKFRFSVHRLFETFLILRRIEPVIVIKVKTSSCKVREYALFVADLVKLEFCLQSFGKVSNIKFYRNPSEFHVDRHTDGRTDGRTNVTKLIVAIRNLTKEPKNIRQSNQVVNRW
jgi:hypothetical protein